jgi:phenylacetate-coenzyme A ligase PaaK-like adenylate-forming protein
MGHVRPPTARHEVGCLASNGTCAGTSGRPDTKRLATEAWGATPFDVYAATETAGIASECEMHAGLHLYEDLVITEAVDEGGHAVPPGQPADRLLVTVLFSRTQPLIRYEISDSVVPSDRACLCGRPFRLIDSVAGRREDVMHLPAATGTGQVAIHPNVIHDVLDRLAVGEWQVVQEPGRIRLLVARPAASFDGADVVDRMRDAMTEAGALPPPIEWAAVETIPRSGSGKARLIRALAGSSG